MKFDPPEYRTSQGVAVVSPCTEPGQYNVTLRGAVTVTDVPLDAGVVRRTHQVTALLEAYNLGRAAAAVGRCYVACRR